MFQLKNAQMSLKRKEKAPNKMKEKLLPMNS